MRRKIVKHGQGTLTVSLPSRWAKEQKLRAGDEIQVTPKQSILEIGEAKPVSKEITIDLSGIGILLPRTVTSIYKAGFDRAKIYYSTHEELAIIQDIVFRN